MGDLQAWSSQPNGILTEEGPVLSSLSSSPGNSQPLPIRDENWSRAEQTTEEIIHRIQPTVVSEQRRRDVIDYVQRLIGGYLRSEVFPFGSVPLKTYLPDGDIDLTALSNQNAEDALASDVRSVLEGEGQNEAAEFEVKDVQYIHAEVKLVKCLVQNIVVDISFNQLGGLCTLCFLETVDNLIGKDHLFKRSIILIKAWCYYESRILGAHHGLISTYALETLVLYIFHLFHSSLNGPLAVLYRFLDCFSKFDWDNYCISLSGPVTISSLPEIVAETAENGGGDLLLSKEFLRSCVDKFSVPSRGLETSSRAFPQKHLNIVDPLKENNNLGRSVSKGNFYRIRSAFTYGARKLGRILLLPGKSMEDELKKFFMNTLDRHGSGQRPDVQDPVPTFAAGGYDPALLKSSIENRREDRVTSESPSIDSSSSVGTVCERISNINISEAEKKPGSRTANEAQRYSTNVSLSQMLLEPDGSANGNAVSGYRLAGDAEDLATFGILSPRNTIETPKSTPLSSKPGTPPFGKVHYAPHLYFPRSFPENGKLGNGNSEQRKPVNSGIIEKVSSRLACLPDEGTDLVCYSGSNHEDANSVGSTNGLQIPISAACTSEDLYLGYQGRDMAGTSGSSEALCYLSDLRGDYDSHFNSLMHCRWFHELAFSGGPVLPISPSPSQVWNKHARDAFYRSVQYKQNMFPHVNANGVVRGPPFYPGNPSMVSSVAFGAEEMPKPRGTGTYFPNTNHHSYRERSSHGRGKNPTPLTQGQLQRPSRNNGRVGTLAETDLVEKGSQELSQAQAPVFVGRQKPDSLELFQSAPSTMKGFPHANGLAFPSERLEFGSFGHPPLGAQSPETSRQLDSGTPYTQGSMSSLPTSAMQRLRPGLGINQERVAVQPYHLKNDDDFPPLSN